jgi:hypothetical protein
VSRRREKDKGIGHGEIEYEGIRSTLRRIADEDNLELVEYRIKDLIKN